MSVVFDFDPQRTLAAVAYIASKNLPTFDKYKVCKLIFLADKRHLVRHGRPITGDTYYALDWGPVPSVTLAALNNNHPLADELRGVLKKERARKGQPRPQHPGYKLRPSQKPWVEFLSKSDLDILDEIVEECGKKTFSELYEITHALPAYYKAWARRKGNRELMRFEEFFEQDPYADPILLKELVEKAALLEELSSANTEFSTVAASALRSNPLRDGEGQIWPFRRRQAHT
jgi:uncharacterized phage-associated protein